MIETGKLSNFNIIRKRDINECSDRDISKIVKDNETEFKLIYFLLTETTRFYTEFFSELQKAIKREKRLVIFETPSRVLMTHEYTIEGANDLKSGFYFLFNVTERLSWLKITLEEQRVSIASKEIVMNLLKSKLGDEIKKIANILNIDEDKVVNRLYYASDGKPCFIEFNKNENKEQQSLLISVTFFDSIREKKTLRFHRSLSPLQEKELNYTYNTLSKDASSWIYFKAPSNFVLSAKYDVDPSYIEISPSNDDEITSLVLMPSGKHLSVPFKISINVPNALKWWYNSVLYTAIVVLLFCIGTFTYSFFEPLSDNIINTLDNCVFTVIGAIIATRGWLMSEEQVMKKMSNRYTILISLLLMMVLSLSTVQQHNLNTKQNTESIQEVQQEKTKNSEEINYSDLVIRPIWEKSVDK